MREREEEMERMREHVFKESDTNKDHLISFEEFMAETKRDEFENENIVIICHGLGIEQFCKYKDVRVHSTVKNDL